MNPDKNIVEVAWNEKQYLVCTGNNFAAPHITGITALIHSTHPELTPFQVKTVLLACAPIRADRRIDERDIW